MQKQCPSFVSRSSERTQLVTSASPVARSFVAGRALFQITSFQLAFPPEDLAGRNALSASFLLLLFSSSSRWLTHFNEHAIATASECLCKHVRVRIAVPSRSLRAGIACLSA